MNTSDLEKLLHDARKMREMRLNGPTKPGDEQMISFDYVLIWLSLTINFLRPLIEENSSESIAFLEKNFSEENEILASFLRRGVETILALDANKEPLGFYTKKYEHNAYYLFFSGVILTAITAVSLINLSSLTVVSISVISAAIFIIFCVAAYTQLQKAKMLDQNFQELKLFENEPLFEDKNKYNLFNKFVQIQSDEEVVPRDNTV
jgi:hypothetical protein